MLSSGSLVHRRCSGLALPDILSSPEPHTRKRLRRFGIVVSDDPIVSVTPGEIGRILIVSEVSFVYLFEALGHLHGDTRVRIVDDSQDSLWRKRDLGRGRERSVVILIQRLLQDASVAKMEASLARRLRKFQQRHPDSQVSIRPFPAEKGGPFNHGEGVALTLRSDVLRNRSDSVHDQTYVFQPRTSSMKQHDFVNLLDRVTEQSRKTTIYLRCLPRGGSIERFLLDRSQSRRISLQPLLNSKELLGRFGSCRLSDLLSEISRHRSYLNDVTEQMRDNYWTHHGL